MPTELGGELGERLRGTGAQPWDEYGTTTGRPRRCGWLDGATLQYALRVNGLTEMAITKLDILSRFETIEVCVAYELDGERIEGFPAHPEAISRCQPVYETLPGWQVDIRDARSFADLPEAAQDYVTFLEELTGIPAPLISVGPARDQTIRR